MELGRATDSAQQTRDRRLIVQVAGHEAAYACLLGEWDRVRGLYRNVFGGLGPTAAEIKQLPFQWLGVSILMTELQTGREAKALLSALLKDFSMTTRRWSMFLSYVAMHFGSSFAQEEVPRLKSLKTKQLAAGHGLELNNRVLLTQVALLECDVVSVRSHYDRVRKHGAGLLTPAAACGVAVDRMLGLSAALMERWEDAFGHFEDALGFCERAGYRPELAWTCYGYADALLRCGQSEMRRRGEQMINRGLALADELRMAPLVERLGTLTKDGGRRPLHPDGLTDREVEVLRELARGMTNREIGQRLFISAKTVAAHIGNIYRKAGLANRAEAASYAIRSGLG
jgi:DNA-binding CsgD family transcriptional regulator